jgi:hypothetical protein
LSGIFKMHDPVSSQKTGSIPCLAESVSVWASGMMEAFGFWSGWFRLRRF